MRKCSFNHPHLEMDQCLSSFRLPLILTRTWATQKNSVWHFPCELLFWEVCKRGFQQPPSLRRPRRVWTATDHHQQRDWRLPHPHHTSTANDPPIANPSCSVRSFNTSFGARGMPEPMRRPYLAAAAPPRRRHRHLQLRVGPPPLRSRSVQFHIGS